MSKPIARITFFVLVSLVLIAATSAGVRGWLGGTSGSESQAASADAHAVGGLQTNLNHDRSTVSELESLQQQKDAQSQPGTGHGCESESPNTNDF